MWLSRWFPIAATLLGGCSTGPPAGKVEPDTAGAPRAAAGGAAGGLWAEFTKDGAFHVAICTVGERPGVGSMFSAEHSSTRDPAVAASVPCPAPIPAMAPPEGGGKALSVRRARELEGGAPPADLSPAAELVTVMKPGTSRSEVRTESGETFDVDNARLVGLGTKSPVLPGDFVLGFHPEVGALRGMVVEGGSATKPAVLRLNGFGSGFFGVMELPVDSIRRVDRDLDPGSLVAIPLADRVELAMVLGVAGTFVVVIDDDDRIRALHRSTIIPMPVKPEPKGGARVWIPVIGDLEAGRVVTVTSGEITAVSDGFSESEPKVYGFGSFIDRDLSLGLYKTIELR